MCRNCTLSVASAHWTAAGEIAKADRLKGRELRVQMLRNLLAPQGIKVNASTLGFGFHLSATDGTTLFTEDASEVWPWVENVLGFAWDPLQAPHIKGSLPQPRA